MRKFGNKYHSNCDSVHKTHTHTNTKNNNKTNNINNKTDLYLVHINDFRHLANLYATCVI